MKLEYAIICDDVRREDNGKLFVIGMYGPAILVPQLPANIVLTLLLAIQADQVEDAPFEFAVKLDGATIREGRGALRVGQVGRNMAGVPGIPLENLQNPGELEFAVRIGNDAAWQSAIKVQFGLNQN